MFSSLGLGLVLLGRRKCSRTTRLRQFLTTKIIIIIALLSGTTSAESESREGCLQKGDWILEPRQPDYKIACRVWKEICATECESLGALDVIISNCAQEYKQGDFLLLAARCECGSTDEAPTVADTLGWYNSKSCEWPGSEEPLSVADLW